MTSVERLIIICLLVSRAMDVKKVVEFVNVIEEGCLSREKDSIDYKNELIVAAKQLPIEGIYGRAITHMLQVHQLDSLVASLQHQKKKLGEIIQHIEKAPKGRLAERILIPKLMQMMKSLPASARL